MKNYQGSDPPGGSAVSFDVDDITYLKDSNLRSWPVKTKINALQKK